MRSFVGVKRKLTVAGRAFACLVCLVTFSLIARPGYSATEYTELVINPQHVGVFWANKTQQFKAWGRFGPGPDDWEDITEMVSWISSDPEIVTIDEAGLATTVQSWGRVEITAKYPKESAPPTQIVVSDHISELLLKESDKRIDQ